MQKLLTRIVAAVLAIAAALLLVFGTKPGAFAYPDGTAVPKDFTVLKYWEKWTNEEGYAMQEVVNRFNLSVGREKKIFVHFVSVSNVDQKTLISTAGDNPPDIAGTWGAQIATFSNYGALLPLTPLREDGTLTPKTYKPFLWKVVAPNGVPFAAVSTPATVALFWNKDHFREAGLDPERPPRTIKELDEYATKLSVIDAQTKDIKRVGFLPNFPGWWDHDWGIFFGASLWDPATRKYSLDSPEQRECFTWYQSYAKRFGAESVSNFSSGFGQFASPQNPFMSGKASMCLQGPWFANFIRIYNPRMAGDRTSADPSKREPHYGAAPVPNNFGEPGAAVIGDLDVWAIPRNAKHPQEAMEAIRYFSRRECLELLCTAHSKPSPLMDVSAEFIAKHPNPYINVFEKDMMSSNVVTYPNTPTWPRVNNEFRVAINKIWKDPTSDVKTELAKAQDAAARYQAEYDHFHTMRVEWEGKSPESRAAK